MVLHAIAARAVVLLALVAAAGVADAQTTRYVKGVYGAVAYDRDSGATGFAYDFPTERAASIAALDQCARRECAVLVAFRNGCGAVADGPVKKPVAAKGATPQEAETKALKACGKDCRMVAWACTK
jgi:hypothetical protein